MVSWYYKGEEITEASQLGEPLGFIYIIRNLTNGKMYVGKKQIFSRRKKKFGKRRIAQMEDKRKKKWEIVYKEKKGWKDYIGSSDDLKEDIANGDSYEKEILHLCNTKLSLKYYETQEIICRDALLESSNYYNANVSIKQMGKLNVDKDKK